MTKIASWVTPETILTALATLSDDDKAALVGALTSANADADADETPRAVARDIVRRIMKDGKIWARRQWWAPRLCDWAGHLVVDRRGTYLFVLSSTKEDSSVLLCKKIALDGDVPSGSVYGQTIVRNVDELKDLGPYTDVRADASAITSGTKPAPRRIRPVVAPAPVVAPVVAPVPAPAPKAPTPKSKSSESLEIPAGATHLVVVDRESGEPARWTTTDEIVRLYLRGKAAQRIMSGQHRVWSDPKYTVVFDRNGQAC